MMLKRTSRIRPNAEINVVPYIDVMLVLLIIFMITAPMLTQGVTVDLPKASNDVIKPNQREPVIVSVNREGQYFLNINTNPQVSISPRHLMVRVAAEIELARQSGDSITVLVKGDQGVSYGQVVIAMSLLKQAGAEQIGLMTEDSVLSEKESA